MTVSAIEKKNVNDLTQGSILKKILLFTLPIFIGSVFQQLYTLIDSIIVSRTLGKEAFTGVSVTGSLVFLILGFAQGLTAGFCVVTSQFFGAKDNERVKKSMATSFILAILFSAVLTAIAVLCREPLLRLIKTDELYFEHANAYITAIFWGLGASVFYNIVSNMLRALGDSRTPLYFLILASFINIGLDFLFILTFKMGVAGAGWATVISQVLSGVACLIYMFIKYPNIRLKKQDFKTDWRFCWKHIKIGLPMGFQFSIISIGIMIQQAAINGLGGAAIPAQSTASKIDNLLTLPFVSLGAAMATFCGQNYGAGQYKRMKEGILKTMLFSIGLLLFILAIVWIFGKSLCYIFVTDLTEEELNLAVMYQRIQSSFYIFLAMIYVYRNALQGFGHSNITVVAGLLELGMRALAAFVLVQVWGFVGVCLSNPIAWIGADLILMPAYFIAISKLTKKQKATLPNVDQLQTELSVDNSAESNTISENNDTLTETQNVYSANETTSTESNTQMDK